LMEIAHNMVFKAHFLDVLKEEVLIEFFFFTHPSALVALGASRVLR
jgi:hypothetical protein